MINFENLDKFIFPGAGPYGIPIIEPVKAYPSDNFTRASDAIREKNPADKTVHFFIDDYKFARFWNKPDKYIPILKKFRAVLSPDFSQYTDMPMAMQIYNQYRKHWLAAYWQMHGITVYPTISWSTPDSYDWCFDGEPVGGIVAVSSVGTQQNKESKRLFLRGYEEMIKRLNPTFVIFYGSVPEECDWNVIKVKTHQDHVREKCKKWVEEEAQEAEAGVDE